MRKASNWSILGIGAGLLLSFLSSVRYFVMFPDLDRALIYITVGLLIAGIAWLYNENVQVKNSLFAIEEYLSDMKYR